jgi:hypothetical protein
VPCRERGGGRAGWARTSTASAPGWKRRATRDTVRNMPTLVIYVTAADLAVRGEHDRLAQALASPKVEADGDRQVIWNLILRGVAGDAFGAA